MQHGIGLALILSLLGLSGCMEPSAPSAPLPPSMSSTMKSCDTPKINDFNSCIQNNYTRDPGTSTVRSFYARMDLIVEEQQNRKISQTKAKAMAYVAYDETVGAGNRASVAAAAAAAAANNSMTCNTYGNTTRCY